MATYLLYRSGIHDATLTFHSDGILFRERNVMTNEWDDQVSVTDTQTKALEDYYHINPREIWERLDEYRNIFQTEKQQVVTSWGLFIKDLRKIKSYGLKERKSFRSI